MFFIFAKNNFMSETIKKTTKGGRRSNSGRKPIADKKMQVWLFIRQSVIEKHGGKDALKLKIEQSIESL